MRKNMVFLCGARDFHAMDWYSSAKEIMGADKVIILTDLIAGEGFETLISENDRVSRLIILDRILFRNQSKSGDLWRNIVKLILLPLQVMLLKRFALKNLNSMYHAHSMYYIILAWAANLNYIATPQGSDILIKPFRSKLYKYFTKKALNKASIITVDSAAMQSKIFELINKDALIIQNGIDIRTLVDYEQDENFQNIELLSIRGLTELYRIKNIIDARNGSELLSKLSLTLIYPFQDIEYFQKIKSRLKPLDQNLGRQNKTNLYKILRHTILAISIPSSDSSPRSVYEAIFCGAIVAITQNDYYNILPSCMKDRIIIVDLEDPEWLEKAYNYALIKRKEKFSPDERSLDMFDQRRSFKKILNAINYEY